MTERRTTNRPNAPMSARDGESSPVRIVRANAALEVRKRSTLPYVVKAPESDRPDAAATEAESPAVSPAPPEGSDRRTTSDVHGRYAFIYGVDEPPAAKTAG